MTSSSLWVFRFSSCGRTASRGYQPAASWPWPISCPLIQVAPWSKHLDKPKSMIFSRVLAMGPLVLSSAFFWAGIRAGGVKMAVWNLPKPIESLIMSKQYHLALSLRSVSRPTAIRRGKGMVKDSLFSKTNGITIEWPLSVRPTNSPTQRLQRFCPDTSPQC